MLQDQQCRHHNICNKHYICTPKTDLLIEPIDDEMPDIISTETPNTKTTISMAVIIAIPFFKSQRICLFTNCGGKVLRTDGGVGKCSTCNMPQWIDMCKQQCSASIWSKFKIHLFADGQTLAQIAETPLEEVKEHILLNANSFSLSYNDRMTITSISHWTQH